MAANRFNQLLGNQEYVSQYIPLPLEAMMKMGQMKQDEFDQGKADIAKTQDLIKINADPHREAIRNDLLKHYNNKINELSDQYIRTGDQSLLYKTNELKREFANDQTRLGLEKSWTNYGEYQKDAQNMNKAGTYDRSTYDAYDRDSIADGKTFDYIGMLNKEDYNTRGNTIMSGIAKDSKAWEGYAKNKTTGLPDIGSMGEYWKKGSSRGGVSLPKVVQIASDNADTFLTSKEGRYFVDEIAGGSVDYKNLKDDQKDILRKRATDYLINIAEKQVGTDTKYTEDLNFLREDLFGGDKKLPPPLSGTTAPSGTVKNDLTVGNVKISDIVKPDGTVDFVKLTENTRDWGATLKFFIMPNYLSGMGNIKPAANKEFYDKMSTIAKANGWDKDANGKPLPGNEVMSKTILSLQNMDVSSGTTYQPTTDAANALSEKMLTQFGKDQMKTGTGSNMKSYEEIANGRKGNFQSYDYSDKDNPRMKVQFTDSKGNTETESFTIPNNDIKAKLAPISAMVGNTQEKLIDPAKRTHLNPDRSVNTDDIQRASAHLLNAFNKNTSITSKMKVDNLGDLYPIGIEYLADGSRVFTYSDKNNAGSIKAMRFKSIDEGGDGNYYPYSSLQEIVIDESNSFFNSNQGSENANKVEKKVTYTTQK